MSEPGPLPDYKTFGQTVTSAKCRFICAVAARTELHLGNMIVTFDVVFIGRPR